MASKSYALITPSTWMLTITPNSNLSTKLLKTYVKSLFHITDTEIQDFPENTIVFTLTYSVKEPNLRAKFEERILNEIKIRKYNNSINVDDYTELLEFLNGDNKTKKRKANEEVDRIQTDSESEDNVIPAPPSTAKKVKFASAKRNK